MNINIARWSLRLGVLLFLSGLLGGFLLPLMANPRMGLASHLEGVINGIFLVALGLMWSQLALGSLAQKILLAAAVYGSYTNWLVTLVAGFWGAGESMMPLAGAGHQGTSVQEVLIGFGLLSLSVSMLVVCGLLLWGLRGPTIPLTQARGSG